MDMIEIELDKKQPATQRLALDYWKQEQLSEDCCWKVTALSRETKAG